MSRDPYTFKVGQFTDKVWCGDIVTKCEFLCETEGRLLFRDHTFDCYRSAFWQRLSGGWVLNGWDCAGSVGGLK